MEYVFREGMEEEEDIVEISTEECEECKEDSVDESDISERNPKTKRRKIAPFSVLFCLACCTTSLCLGRIHEMDAVMYRENFSSMSAHQQRQWVLDYLWSHSRYNAETSEYDFVYVIGTTTVCCAAWLLTLGFPKSTFYELRKKFLKGEKIVEKTSRKGRRSIKSLTSLSWLQRYAERYAEKIPNDTKLHLPTCCTKIQIYLNMKEELGEREVVSQSHFMHLWRDEMTHIAIPKRSRFSKCNTCTLIKTKLAQYREPSVRNALLKRRDEHLQQQNAERRKYYKHVIKAKENPGRYLSIIIDAMDQSKTYLPHFLLLSKFIHGMMKLRLHLVGVIIHGIGVYGFFDFFQWNHSTNLTVTVLTECLLMMTSIPDTLYLQLDNCYRENKNRYMLGFLCLLVEKGIFKKVKMSFLMVGHTHEDIDQLFSRFSSYLTKHTVLTMDKMMMAFESCYNPQPEAIRTSRVFNISNWLFNYMDDIHGQSRPHVFKIISVNGKATIFWKKWSTDTEWIMCQNPLLKQDVTSRPEQIPPNSTDIDFEKLKKDVYESFQYFSNEEDKEWWRQFFKKPDFEEDLRPWPMHELMEIKLRGKDNDTRNDDPQAAEVDDELNIERESAPILPVCIGRKNVQQSNQIENRTPKTGDLVLVDIQKYAGEWPQIGKVTAVDRNSVSLQWLKGSKTTPWTLCKKFEKGRKGSTPWVENVPLSSIWHWGFNLTPSGHLSKKIKDLIDDYDH